jgi:hypothetical protein
VEKKKILISPLDWGLGHTTRCIPLIKKLLERGHQITVACNELQKTVLQTFNLKVSYVFLEGYNVAYSKNNRLALKIMTQIPRIMNVIKAENNWVQQYVKENEVDFIISDNRFGFYHPQIESVYITHQINIQSNALLNPILFKLHDVMIKNFHHCWVPDTPNNSYAGELSLTKNKSNRYIGLLTRFEKSLNESDDEELESKKFEFGVLISGPEPQRSMFEKQIIDVFSKVSSKIVVISSSSQYQINDLTEKITIETLPNPTLFLQLISQSEKIILRSGYSSIMDFAVLQKPLYFVPTTGQTEQEYLAGFHKKNNSIGWCKQENFKIPMSDEFGFLKPYIPSENNWLEETLDSIGL